MASLLARPSNDLVPNKAYSVTHRGIDYGWGDGDQVYAAEAGMISYSTVFGYGKQLTINHGDLIARGAKTKYSHLARAVVTSGWVKRGQLIGYMGNTGIYAKGKHLHFELLVNSGPGYAKVNPTPYFTDTAGGGGVKPIPAPNNPKEKNVTIYYYTNDDKPAGTAATTEIVLFALAGESPGTSANWLETASKDIKASWSSAHGAGVFLTKASFDSFKARYLEPLKTAGGTSGAYTGPTAAEIAKAVNDDAAKRLVN